MYLVRLGGEYMSIRLSEKHGVNPSVEQCFYCMKDMGVVLFGRMKGDVKAPYKVCLPDQEPCAQCKEYMKQGVVLVSVRDPAPGDDQNNPYRTGGWVVVKDDLIRKAVKPKELVDNILKKRVAFIPETVWKSMGLPTAEANEVQV